MAFLSIVPLVALAASTVLLMVQDVAAPNPEVSRWIAAASLAFTAFLSAVLGASGTTGTVGGMFRFDSYAQFFDTVFSLSAFLVVLQSAKYQKSSKTPFEMNVLVIASTIGMFLVAASTNLLSLFVSFELATVGTYALVGYSRDSQRSSEAAIKFFVVGALSAGVILYGISLIFLTTGTLGITSAITLVDASEAKLLGVAFVLLIAGFGFKIAAVPFHFWLPDTYDGAPYPATSFLASASKIMGFAALVKVFLVMGPAVTALSGLDWRLLFGVLSLITMTVGNLAAMVQTNVKRMLAYSSIAMSGYIMIGLALGTAYAFSALLYFTLSYAVSKIGSFIVADFFETEHGARTVEEYSWLARASPFSAVSLSFFLLSLAGIPPLAVFVAKFFIFYAAVQVGGLWIWLAVAGVLNSALSLYYYARVIKSMYLGFSANSERKFDKITESWYYAIPTIIALGFTFALGVAEAPVLGAASHSLQILTGALGKQVVEGFIFVFRLIH
jgi:proton-translocating NADH-quinone oxidoreductase chain N